MSTPSPFHVARETSNNFSNSFKRVNDENVIENILSQAMGSGDPEVLQNSIGQILSQVSPERQGAAIQYLQGTMNNLKEKQAKSRRDAAAKQSGINPDLSEAIQLEQFKSNAKDQRINNILGSGSPRQNVAPSQNQTQPPFLQGMAPNAQATPLNQPQQQNQSIPNNISQSDSQSPFSRFTDGQLVALTGAQDKEISEPAKAELKRRDESRKIDQKKQSDVFKNDLDRSTKVLERADEIAETLPQKRSALNMMKDAIVNKNLSFWSRDNLAEISGIEGFRSPEGSIFKTAAKEYFLGNISRAGARPNQWIEQQIADMMTKIGRSTEANLSVSRALENELDIDTERVKLTEEISDRLREEGDYSQGKLGSLVNKDLTKFAEAKQSELFNDLRAIKSIAEKQPQKFRKVEKGTKVSKVVAQALLRQFNNDPEKAAAEAKKLGYEF